RATAGKHLLGEAAIDLRVPFEDHHIRAELLRFGERHPGFEPEPPCFVGARCNHAGADEDGFALETRVTELLDRGEKGVDVYVQDELGRCVRARWRARDNWLRSQLLSERRRGASTCTRS